MNDMKWKFFDSYDMKANAPMWPSHFKTDYLLKISTGQRQKSLPWIKNIALGNKNKASVKKSF